MNSDEEEGLMGKEDNQKEKQQRSCPDRYEQAPFANNTGNFIWDKK